MPNAFTTQDESRLYVIGDNGWYICTICVTYGVLVCHRGFEP